MKAQNETGGADSGEEVTAYTIVPPAGPRTIRIDIKEMPR